MPVFDDADAIDVDPLSAFPAESKTIPPQNTSGKAVEIGRDLSSPEVITALFSAAYDLQTSVNSLTRELGVTGEIARGVREDIRNAIKAIQDLENRIGALESRHVIRVRSSILSTRANVQRLSRYREWCVTSWRRLLAATQMMFLALGVRSSRTLQHTRAAFERRRID